MSFKITNFILAITLIFTYSNIVFAEESASKEVYVELMPEEPSNPQSNVSYFKVEASRTNIESDYVNLNYTYTKKESPSDDTTQIYIPFTSDTAKLKNSIFSNATNNVPNKTNGYLRLGVNLKNNTDGDKYLYGSYYADSGYKIFKIGSSTHSGITFERDSSILSLTLTIRLSDVNGFCEQATICSLTSETISKKIHLFLSSSNYSAGNDVNSADLDNGLYLSLNFSDVVSDSTVTLNNIVNGDKRVFVNYSVPSIPSNPWKLVTFSHNSGQASMTYFDASKDGSILNSSSESEIQNSGVLEVNNLDNDSVYNISIAAVDKFYFSTLLSSSLEARPESIEVLLEKNACYLLTAGFQHEHYILNYFRLFRDEVLQNSHYGKKFVLWYYRTAPYFAETIYKSPFLSSCVRGIAYLFYFVIKYCLVLLVISIIGFFVYTYRLEGLRTRD